MNICDKIFVNFVRNHFRIMMFKVFLMLVLFGYCSCQTLISENDGADQEESGNLLFLLFKYFDILCENHNFI